MNTKKKRIMLNNGASITYIENPKFNHNRLTINFITEINKDDAALNAVTAMLLKLGSGDYPNMTKLNRKLNELYGAVLSSDISLYGKYQVIDISIIAMDDKFSMESESNILKQCADLLCSVVFNPILFTEFFTDEMLQNEKNILEEIIKSEINDKQTYALYKCKQQICSGEPFGISKYGYLEDLERMGREEIRKAYKKLIEYSRIEVVFVGNSYDSYITDIIKESLNFPRHFSTKVDCKFFVRNFEKIISEKENIKLNQERLVMGFDFTQITTENEKNSLRLFSYLFGNSSNSKLFKSIREEKQLCYYCAAHIDTMAGLLLVECVTDKHNHEEAVSEILKQLDICREGGITDDEINEAKLALVNEIYEVEDFVDLSEDWYTNQIITGKMHTPQNQIDNLNSLTKDDIVSAVKKLRFFSVFGLI